MYYHFDTFNINGGMKDIEEVRTVLLASVILDSLQCVRKVYTMTVQPSHISYTRDPVTKYEHKGWLPPFSVSGGIMECADEGHGEENGQKFPPNKYRNVDDQSF